METTMVWVNQYGYLVLFLLPMLELLIFGLPVEILMSYAGFLVFQGRLSWPLSIFMASTGSIIGMSIAYGIGSKLGAPFFAKYGHYLHLGPEKLVKTAHWFDKYGSKVLIIAYFIPGIRHLTGYFSGINQTEFRKYILHAYLGALLWVSTFISLGKILGPQWEQFHSSIKKYLIVLVIVVSAAFLFIHLFRSYRLKIKENTLNLLTKAIEIEQRIYQDAKSELRMQSKIIMAEMEVEDGEINSYKMNLARLSNSISENMSSNTLVIFYGQNGEILKKGKIPKALLKKDNISTGFSKIDQDGIGNWVVLTEAVKQNQQIIGRLSLFHSLEKEERVLHRLLTILILGVPLTLLLASIGGYFLAWRALSPINHISKTAKEISHSNLSRRLEETGTDDEVGSLILTLNQLLARLEGAFKRQKEFTADASHDLRTPITVIRTQAEKTLKRPRSEEEYCQTLDKIIKQAEHMSHLVEQLLQLARTDIGKEKLQLEVLDMGQLVQLVVEEMQEMASQKGLNPVNIIEDQELFLKGDQTKLTQLLVNLIANAIQYTPAGGKITLRIKQMKNEIMLQVTDTGCGIPQEDQEHIFERFYKVDKARTRQNGGTGLGLAICRWIVNAHGGRIELNSKPGKGSIFTVYLPKNII